ncbi:MAG TPA: DegT/DnrJ/EryC1/StrS family aminotransferase [Blastocatellia bacterium]|nr:DegT/DnrJ/EryC1/StrS family aminotransferase [Blastocatellia bacterium]
MTDRPVSLGGSPIFDNKIEIVRPVLPAFEELEAEIQDILRSGMVTKGRHVAAFEQAVAAHLGVKNAVAVSSCTLGLMLTYRGLGLTGDVIVPSFTFMASVSSLVWSGLKPVFADVDLHTTNIDPAAVEYAITPSTTAILAVHNFGNPAKIDELSEIAKKCGLRLIFDAAHGFGALYRGVPVGPQGTAHVYSLSPTKLLIAGEGGIVATNDDSLAERIRIGREYGNDGNYGSDFAGLNARMPELSALMGIHSLRNLEQAAQHRNRVADLYRRELGRLRGISFQKIADGNRSSYREFSILVDEDSFGLNRDQLALAMTAENIDTRKYYDPPVHRHMAYKGFAPSEASLCCTEMLASRSLSLPMWSHMSDRVLSGICRAIRRIHECAPQVKNVLDPQMASSAT